VKCDKCQIDFPESNIEVSHDIPKYIGGTDLDGRHNLCKECHIKYDNLILKKCLELFNEEFIEEERIIWMKELSKQPKDLKGKFKKIAQEIGGCFFDG